MGKSGIDGTSTQNLRRIDDGWHLTIDAVPDGVALVGRDRKILCCNKSMEKTFGTTSDKLRGVVCHHCLHNRPEPLPECPMTLTLQDGMEHSAEIWSDQRDRCLLVTTTPHLDESGEVIGCGHISRDITESRRGDENLRRYAEKLADSNSLLEEAFRRASKLAAEAEAANKAKDEFLATTSHELRTPLNAMIGFCEILMDTELTRDQREAVEVIRGRGLDLASIINDILDLAKIEAGVIDISSAPLDLVGAISEVVEVVRPMAAGKGLSMRVCLQSGIPRGVRGDVLRVKQILINLLSNAVKFTEKGGVEVAVELLDCNAADGAVKIQFSVTDTGIGIPMDMRERIFESFAQVDGSMTRKFGGTGLGLAISKRLVQKMGGMIWVESEMGKGSTFKLVISFKPVPPPAGATVSAEARQLCHAVAPKRILLVEDDPMSAKYVETSLGMAGHAVKMAWNGSEAIKAVRNHPFDIILMDVQMPDMSGMEATKAIRDLEASGELVQVNGCRKLWIVAYTAFAMIGDKEKFLAAGMDDYLAKPLRKGELLAALERASRIPPDDARE